MGDLLRLAATFVVVCWALGLGGFGWHLAYGDSEVISARSDGRSGSLELVGLLCIVAAIAGVLWALRGLWGSLG
jgi:hypothetical protein